MCVAQTAKRRRRQAKLLSKGKRQWKMDKFKEIQRAKGKKW